MMSIRMFVLALVVAGCASAPSGDGGQPRRDVTRITAEDIERAHYTNVYELVRALRPT